MQEKVLSLIQSWADAFRGDADMSGVVSIYQDLRHKGIQFPMTDLDLMAPIQTPPRTVQEDPTKPKTPEPKTPAALPPVQQQQESTRSQPRRQALSFTISPEQLAKLKSELDIVKANVKVLNDMLNALPPNQENSAADLQLMKVSLHSNTHIWLLLTIFFNIDLES